MFDHQEDRQYFDTVLQDVGGVDANSHLFDFRAPEQKRRKFNAIRDSVFASLKQRYGSGCRLNGHEDCSGVGTVVDHLIPLSSNVLNKSIRGMKATAKKKAPTQSFGSNHSDNFVLACRRCNDFKKSKIPTSELINDIFLKKGRRAA